MTIISTMWSGRPTLRAEEVCANGWLEIGRCPSSWLQPRGSAPDLGQVLAGSQPSFAAAVWAHGERWAGGSGVRRGCAGVRVLLRVSGRGVLNSARHSPETG